MSITPLSAARIAGEVGLAGGTVTGGAFAAKYSGRVNTIAEEITKTKDADIKSKEQKILDIRKNTSNLTTKMTSVYTYWTQYQSGSNEYESKLTSAIEDLQSEINSYVSKANAS